MGMILIIKPDGNEASLIAPDYYDGSDEVFRKKIQEIVGGYIEVVWVDYNGIRTAMIVNEEGRIIGLPFNKKATEIYYTGPAHHDNMTVHKRILFDLALNKFNPIVGNAILCVECIIG